jgi:hypothetical protein
MNTALYPDAPSITIKINDYDEYEVPTGDSEDGIYYTDDKLDAQLTASEVYGAGVKIRFRRVHRYAD